MQLPNRNALKQMSRKARRKAGNVVPKPTNLQDLILPESLTTLDNGTNFLLHDSLNEVDGSRIIIFSTQKNLDLLARCKKLMSDGTFSTAPTRHFNQLYTIHGETIETSLDKKPVVHPLVYALLNMIATRFFNFFSWF